MARGTVIVSGQSGSTAAYKAYYQPISTIFNQAMTRTADTGQVNWATVPSESSGVRDYEVFAFTGSLQATAPIYIRIDYQGGTVGFVAVTVGTTTDGAGNLGGLLVAKQALNGYYTTSSGWQNPRPAWAASDGTSYATFLYGIDPNGTTAEGVGMFAVERTRDAAGAATGSGFHVWRWWRNGGDGSVTYLGGWSKTFGGGTQTSGVDYNFGIHIPDAYQITTAFTGLSSKAFPAYTYTIPLMGGASKALAFGFPGDFPRGKTVTLDFYGEMMTYVPLAAAVPVNLPVMSSSAGIVMKTVAPLIRWD